MKAKKLIPLILSMVIALAGCKAGDSLLTKEDLSTFERIQNTLISMESYQATARVEYISNKNTHTYETFQQAKLTGQYRIEVTGPERVAGNVTISDGRTIAQFNPQIAGKIAITTTEAPERHEIFFTTFVLNYVRSQEVSISAANIDENVCTVLEAQIPGDHPYLHKEKLWVNNETLKPVKMVIYDPEGGERIIITYDSFEFNVELSDALFRIE